jgi:acetylornithine/N-succinyldiaminopimelate aminotransferase
MSLAAVSRLESKLLLPTYERQPILFVRGRGVHLWDSTGKRYLDFLSGIGVNALGHAHPAIQAVIRRQAGRLEKPAQNKDRVTPKRREAHAHA